MTLARLDVVPEQRRGSGRRIAGRPAQVVVIGGGFAGMAAALRLAQLGVPASS